MLPTREEIDTEWIIDKRKESSMDATGFENGAMLFIYRIEGLTESDGYVFVYKFNSVSGSIPNSIIPKIPKKFHIQ